MTSLRKTKAQTEKQCIRVQNSYSFPSMSYKVADRPWVSKTAKKCARKEKKRNARIKIIRTQSKDRSN